ncbi:CAAX prenyl protease-like protein [Gelidibacter algens]|jgi:membrane protease YdiL (CAAX protease family)|uniref:CAAX prenyl protease-like protein n=1 Tax=Gelidibacter algens TaxID=49280 RepID=A0A1A7R6D2_9FLAO|nr:type II CAAX endopeptidase family protein [Gelidibacter algens]OBX26307.1 abortive infection protein [Gelidibacter algens]RAJ24805.1 CAAX prenyl protease-like protein [Gelidibacter algens]
MQSVTYKLTEFFLIFIILPVSFALHYPFLIKACLAISGFIYVIYVLVKVEGNQFKLAPNIRWMSFWRAVFVKFLVIACLTIGYMLLTAKAELFHVLYQQPKLWVIMLFAYAMFSVYPQELIFRTLYFQRYASLFTSRSLFVFINATVFSLAHIFYRNPLVLLITFLGGILFALTYDKTKSTLLVSIEHAIYGCWLFTVGMGHMLGFPG